MKQLAVILSFYILSMSAGPFIQIIRAEFFSGCGKSCSKTPSKNTDGCEKKDCPVFSCCYKGQLLFMQTAKQVIHYHWLLRVENNFNYNRAFNTLKASDIWHPPKYFN